MRKRKGDVNRYIMLFLILLVLTIIIIGLYYTGLTRMIQAIWEGIPR